LQQIVKTSNLTTDYATPKTASGVFHSPAAEARRLTSDRLKADPLDRRIDQVYGGYGQQRRTRKWAAFAFVMTGLSAVIVREGHP
jgi:hypothetical protein